MPNYLNFNINEKFKISFVNKICTVRERWNVFKRINAAQMRGIVIE